jgi:hypothetical protein
VPPPSSQVGETIAPVTFPVTDAENDPTTCSFSGLPADLAESSECTITGTVTAAAGDYPVTVTAYDGQLPSVPVNFTWPIVAPPPTPPELVDPVDQTNEEGDAVYLAVQGSDINGDPLSFSATGLPPGLDIVTVEPTPGTFVGEITGTIQNGAAAEIPYSVIVTVVAAGQSDSAPFKWTVYEANEGPIVTNPGLQSSHAGEIVVLPIIASDPEQWPLTFTASGLPSGLNIDDTGKWADTTFPSQSATPLTSPKSRSHGISITSPA